MSKRKPVNRHKFGHLDVIINSDADGGKTFGIYTNYDQNDLKQRPVFSGVIKRDTGRQLRRIAGEMDLVFGSGA